MKPLLQQVQQPQTSTLHDNTGTTLPNLQEDQQHSQQQQQQHQLQGYVAAVDDSSDPFAENRAKKAAKRDKFLGRERQQMQLEQLRALVSEPKPQASVSGAAEVEGVRTIATSSGGWGVKVTGASFFCKAADEAATQWQVVF